MKIGTVAGIVIGTCMVICGFLHLQGICNFNSLLQNHRFIKSKTQQVGNEERMYASDANHAKRLLEEKKKEIKLALIVSPMLPAMEYVQIAAMVNGIEGARIHNPRPEGVSNQYPPTIKLCVASLDDLEAIVAKDGQIVLVEITENIEEEDKYYEIMKESLLRNFQVISNYKHAKLNTTDKWLAISVSILRYFVKNVLCSWPIFLSLSPILAVAAWFARGCPPILCINSPSVFAQPFLSITKPSLFGRKRRTAKTGKLSPKPNAT